ncbi:MAG: hypothetical protein HYV99_06170 [Betaproteobacteria bacterium]|nr:hypothetical protein [Betaproteobacteria bacterium]
MLTSRLPTFRNAVLAALLAAALGACADVRWHKPGAGAAELDRELGQCRQEARFRSAREAGLPGSALPQTIVVDPQGRTIAVQPRSPDSERFLLEHDLMRLCMRQKGYELAPEPPASVRN